jgi:hypothetical protein
VLAREDSNSQFETFYDAYMRKIMLAEKRTRYAAKANYHVARLGFLSRLYPDARFIIPVRAPATHIESLARQQRSFAQGQKEHPRALAFMQRSGHFEFGLDRRPMNLGDSECVQQIIQAWTAGEEVRGLAMYWDMVHGYLASLLASDEQVRTAALVVRFEALCSDPVTTLRAVFTHCGLSDTEEIVQTQAVRMRTPNYYESRLSTDDLNIIRTETAESASLWGY